MVSNTYSSLPFHSSAANRYGDYLQTLVMVLGLSVDARLHQFNNLPGYLPGVYMGTILYCLVSEADDSEQESLPVSATARR